MSPERTLSERDSGRRDIDERDRAVLALLRPHLASIRERWERRHRPPLLTARETHVLELVAEGLTNAEVATRLAISHTTVCTHLENVFDKLGVHTRTTAVAWLNDVRRASSPGYSRDTALNRERKLARVRAGRAHAALVFDREDCVGWCQFGAPDEVPKIKNRVAYEKSLTILPDWRIACNFVGKGHRRQGVATAALEVALDLDRRSRRRHGRGLPRGGFGACGLPLQRRPVDLREAGFVRDRKLGKHRWVVTKVVEPTS